MAIFLTVQIQYLLLAYSICK